MIPDDEVKSDEELEEEGDHVEELKDDDNVSDEEVQEAENEFLQDQIDSLKKGKDDDEPLLEGSI